VIFEISPCLDFLSANHADVASGTFLHLRLH
jgi:hypothetical protein